MLERLRDGVDELVGTDPVELSDAALADQLLAARREMDRLDGAFARLAITAHRRGVGACDGAASTAAWLRHRAGMREGEARAAVEAGEVTDLLAETGEAWRSGEITSGAARTIVGARVAGHDEQLMACEPVLLDLARRRDLRSLRRAAGHFRNLARGDGSPPGAHDGLSLSRSYEGRLVLDGEYTDLAAETIATAIHAYTDPPTGEDRRTTAQRRAAALVRVCEIALARAGARRRATQPAPPGGVSQPSFAPPSPVQTSPDADPDAAVDANRDDTSSAGIADDPEPAWIIPNGAEEGWALQLDHPESANGRRHRAIPHVAVTLDWTTLTHGTLGASDGEYTGPIHPQDIERLLCDCQVSRVVTGPEGLPLDVGRTRRTVPPALRRALVARDGGCRFPGCDRPPGWCDAHHLVPWHAGGPTSIGNLALFCDQHHDQVHQPGWTVKFDGYDIHVFRPDGTEVLE